MRVETNPFLSNELHTTGLSFLMNGINWDLQGEIPRSNERNE